MEIYEIINHLIEKRDYESYLEIGLSIPECNFTKVKCEHKESVDPYENTDLSVDSGAYKDSLPENIRQNLTYLMTSDEMFKSFSEDKKFDIVFIDGMHTEEQCCRDIANSMAHLNEGGCILVHDSIPLSEKTQHTERDTEAWNGDVWKSIVKLSTLGIEYRTVKVIHGLTIIEYCANVNFDEYIKKSNLTYSEDFSLTSVHAITEAEFEELYTGRTIVKSNLPVNLVAHFYVPWYMHGIPPIYRLHFECLKYYSKIFTNVVFVLSVDENTPQDAIQKIEREIFNMGFTGDISIKIKPNTAYREGYTFKTEIIDKLQELEGITYFIHGKGITNIGRKRVNKESVLDWIASSYFQLFDDFTHVVDFLICRNTGLAYGAFLYKNQDCLDKNGWYYSGSFQCLNTKKLYNWFKSRNLHIPDLCDRAYAETFLGDSFEYDALYTGSYESRIALSYPLLQYSQSEEATKYVIGENIVRYNKFKHKVVKAYEEER